MIWRRFFWKLFLSNAALLLIAMIGSVWMIAREFDRFYMEELGRHLRAHALSLQYQLENHLDPAYAPALNDLAHRIVSSGIEGLRITLVDADGTVLADSEAPVAQMESHSNRPEICDAMTNGWGQSTRWSKTVNREMKYVALRAGSAEAPDGVIRVAMNVVTIGARTQTVRALAWTVTLIAATAAVGLALGLAGLWSRRISRITRAARKLSRGELTTKLDITGHDETAVLARSLNRMGDHLARHLDTIDHQRRTLESLVAQLRDGVIVADSDGRIVLVNPAAVKLLGLVSPRSDKSFVGLTVEQCVPQRDVQLALQPTANLPIEAASSTGSDSETDGSTDSAQEMRIRVGTSDDALTLLAQSCDISLPSGIAADRFENKKRKGRLIIMTDVTELTQTLQMKTDFAVNASHELRTPLSAMRAAVDTLRSVDLVKDSKSANHFLQVADRHCTRMESIAADLLDLARVESARRTPETRRLRVRDLIDELYAVVANAVADQQLSWEVDIDEACNHITADPELLHMILRNLIDNAIEFTNAGGQISIRARRIDSSVAIDVIDNGCGIPAVEQNRIFERFYQVERSRSGQRRGSGLGLAIVRHAVKAMGGSIDLKSAPGRGTTVTVRFPNLQEL